MRSLLSAAALAAAALLSVAGPTAAADSTPAAGTATVQTALAPTTGPTPAMRQGRVGGGDWHGYLAKDGAGRVKNILLMLNAEETVDVSGYRSARPTLVVRCLDGGLQAYVVFDRFLGMREPRVAARLDAADDGPRPWATGAGFRTVGLWDRGSATPLVRDLLASDYLTLRVEPEGLEPVQAVFMVAGLDGHMESLRSGCGWRG